MVPDVRKLSQDNIIRLAGQIILAWIHIMQEREPPPAPSTAQQKMRYMTKTPATERRHVIHAVHVPHLTQDRAVSRDVLRLQGVRGQGAEGARLVRTQGCHAQAKRCASEAPLNHHLGVVHGVAEVLEHHAALAALHLLLQAGHPFFSPPLL